MRMSGGYVSIDYLKYTRNPTSNTGLAKFLKNYGREYTSWLYGWRWLQRAG